MTNPTFVKDWLSAPEKVKALFVPDDRQEWVCPECLKILAENRICLNHGMTKVFVRAGLVSYLPIIPEAKPQPIPRFDQLMGMMQIHMKWHLEVQGEFPSYRFTCPIIGIKLDWENTPEEALLRGILWENELKRRERIRKFDRYNSVGTPEVKD